MQTAYCVIDIGTGNVRVAIVKPDGEVLGVGRGDIQYLRDDRYPDSIYFDPEQLYGQLIQLGREAAQQAGPVTIAAFTATSQREGIVLISKTGQSLIGLPNIDHRGREWEGQLANKSRVYQLTGRYPTSLFSAFKLEGIRQRRTELWNELSTFLSISDWVEYKLSGIAKYEHAQASETLLYDVAAGAWSNELADLFNIPGQMMPPLMASATIIGPMTPEAAASWKTTTAAVVITGGGDTQLAIKSTLPAVDDMVIVSGTTTPIVKLVGKYLTDTEERTWTSRDIEGNRFVFEANAGVTGLNYQRLKEVFYPNEGYDVIEKELAQNPHRHCAASLGSLIASERSPVIRGGFVFPAPVNHELTRSCFVWATLLDIAFSIAENFKVLQEVAGHKANYVWACGGGLQSKALRQLIANIIGKKVQVRNGFQQSSAVGGALVCNEALQTGIQLADTTIEVVSPQEEEAVAIGRLYEQWRQTRNYFHQISASA
ncbi:FGGY family carbohydrate kinase [Paraflavitalea sp. CAU 1676]|uniref:FGGY-family carbohydrate kinase n=1 Tax=Paraflavitalea sp. CAU 1676 TaxID=3032598 RepID=UPI0023DCC908|nr:FGGY family carbohydrate kinase [Paraflavitalea sp. CAU 1676]MDF2191151.1 FGGY family carbohydrate kinase [Paraflavitalea sp. CAU 1676]